jgi:hypothetical protein
VEDALYASLRDVATPTFYVPTRMGSPVSVRVHGGPPAQLAASVAAAIGGVDTQLSISVRPLAADFDLYVARERILALLSGFFGALALLLSAIGLYGLVSYGVGTRRTEIGIRLALGAGQFRVVWVAVRRVALLAAVGVLVGIPISLWSLQFVSAPALRPSGQRSVDLCLGHRRADGRRRGGRLDSRPARRGDQSSDHPAGRLTSERSRTRSQSGGAALRLCWR